MDALCKAELLRSEKAFFSFALLLLGTGLKDLKGTQEAAQLALNSAQPARKRDLFF